jgi:hypothetical protein
MTEHPAQAVHEEPSTSIRSGWALRRDFMPVALEASVSFDVRNEWREVETRNVVAGFRAATRRARTRY